VLNIGITSNIKKYYKGYIDFVDHYWLKAFEKKKYNFKLIPNNKFLSEKVLNEINILILAGGNDIESKNSESKIRNKIEINLIKKAIKKKIPILGICRGAQIVNILFGGKIKKIQGHMRTRHDLYLNKNRIFKKRVMNVNSFHSYGISIKSISKKFEIIALDKKNNVEMYTFKKKIVCTMWHPEREKNLGNLVRLINYLKK